MGTVLINDVTKDDINAALIRIQKQIGNSSGGSGNAQGTSQTIQNIQIQNSGSGGSSSELMPMVTQLRTTISEQNQRITMLENTNKELQRNLLDIQSVMNNGVTGNITTVSFDDATRMLNFVTDASTGQVSIPDGAFVTNVSGPSAYLFSFGCKEGEVARFSFCVGNAHKRDINETDSLRVMSYSLVNITVEKKVTSGARHIVTINGFCTESPETPISTGIGMGDIVIYPEYMDLSETKFKVYIITDSTHNDFSVWWKVFINQSSSYEIGDYSAGPVDETDTLWNSRYGFNPNYLSSSYFDLTKSYSHFRNLNGGGGSTQQTFDAVHPVGEIYIQYPQQKSPSDLYNHNGITSTWTLQTQYDGAFFRASGGNASTFIEEGNTLTKQSQATAKNGLDISSTLSVGNSSSGGTSNVTGGMSANSSGSVNVNIPWTSANSSGAMSLTSSTTNFCSGSSSQSVGKKISVNVSHTHAVYLRGNVTLGNGDTETRPANYTICVWKRTA